MNLTELKFRMSGWLGRILLGSYFPFIRFEKEGEEHFEAFRRNGEPYIFVFWHSQLLPLVYHHRNQGIVVLVSDHKDGEYITRVIHRHGFETARGSSTRGGVKGLKGALRAAKAGKVLGFAPDGPKGPRQEFKWGALVAAQLSGLPVITIGVGADRAWHLDSWDRFMIPKPFSNLRIRYGKPRWVPRDTTEDGLKEIGKELETELREFTLELNPAEAGIREELHGRE
jgi:lysophospholipid acyltransferase (LPLAT)-like uncharacterized protein